MKDKTPIEKAAVLLMQEVWKAYKTEGLEMQPHCAAAIIKRELARKVSPMETKSSLGGFLEGDDRWAHGHNECLRKLGVIE